MEGLGRGLDLISIQGLSRIKFLEKPSGPIQKWPAVAVAAAVFWSACTGSASPGALGKAESPVLGQQGLLGWAGAQPLTLTLTLTLTPTFINDCTAEPKFFCLEQKKNLHRVSRYM